MNIRAAFDKASDDAGWNDDAEYEVLMDFLELEQMRDPLILFRFQEFLNARVAETR